MANLSLGRLAAYTWPISLVAFIIGVVFLLRPIRPKSDPDKSPHLNGRSSLRAVGPILVAVIGALTGNYLLGSVAQAIPSAAEVSPVMPTLIFLILAVLLATIQERRPSLLVKAVLSGLTARTLYLVVAILTFQSAVQASGAVTALNGLMTSFHMPLPFLIGGLTFFLGLLTGYSMAYVAAAYPVFLGLLPLDSMLPYLILGHVTGFTGVLISPAHACLVLSNEYFKAPAGQFYWRLLPLICLALIFGLFWFLFLVWVG
jgi:hypothetical protein